MSKLVLQCLKFTIKNVAEISKLSKHLQGFSKDAMRQISQHYGIKDKSIETVLSL
jgi:hypothetical protein